MCAILAAVLAVFCKDIIFAAAWLGLFIGLSSGRLIRSYISRNIFTALLSIAAILIVSYTMCHATQWAYQHLNSIPYLGVSLMVLIDLAALLVPSVVVNQLRHKTKKKIANVVPHQVDWDTFGAELTYNYASEAHENARKGKGFRADALYVRKDFMEKIVPQYQHRVAEAMTPKYDTD